MSGYGFFARYYDALTGNVNYDARAIYFDRLMQKYMPRSKLVLDLACGTGSLSFALARRGYDVIGADASYGMLSEAMRKSGESNEKILFLNQEMDKLDLYGTVDAAICALDSLNHIGNTGKLSAVFKKVALFTNPGGLFIFDVNTPHKHRDILGNNAFVYDLPEVFCCWQNSYSASDCRVDIKLDFFAPDKNGCYTRETENFSEWAYSDETLMELLSESGFTHIATYDEDSFDAPTMLSQRLVYISKRK